MFESIWEDFERSLSLLSECDRRRLKNRGSRMSQFLPILRILTQRLCRWCVNISSIRRLSHQIFFSSLGLTLSNFVSNNRLNNSSNPKSVIAAKLPSKHTSVHPDHLISTNPIHPRKFWQLLAPAHRFAVISFGIRISRLQITRLTKTRHSWPSIRDYPECRPA
jgi:hypothetical protein